jgi:hypothetical protein
MYLEIRDEPPIPCEAVRVSTALNLERFTAQDGIVEIVITDSHAKPLVRLLFAAHMADRLARGIAEAVKDLATAPGRQSPTWERAQEEKKDAGS